VLICHRLCAKGANLVVSQNPRTFGSDFGEDASCTFPEYSVARVWPGARS